MNSADARRALRSDPMFCVYYEIEAGSGIQQQNRTKEQNDNFAVSLEFMGATLILKSEWNPETRKWEHYT